MVNHSNKYLYLIIIILLGFILLQQGCEKELPKEKDDYSHLYEKMSADSMIIVSFMEKAYQDSLAKEKYKIKADSSQKVADKFKKLYKSVSGDVIIQISQGVCDTNSVKRLVNVCDSTISAISVASIQKDTVIMHQEKENNDLRLALKASNDMNDAARQILTGTTEENKALKAELKDTKRKNKIKTTLLIIGDVIKDALLIFALK